LLRQKERRKRGISQGRAKDAKKRFELLKVCETSTAKSREETRKNMQTEAKRGEKNMQTWEVRRGQRCINRNRRKKNRKVKIRSKSERKCSCNKRSVGRKGTKNNSEDQNIKSSKGKTKIWPAEK